MCAQVCVYPTCVCVLKHFKKLNLLNFGWRSWFLLVDYLLVPVAQLFPIKKLLWEKYKKASIRRPKGERIERKITLLRLSLTILVLPALPPLQETLVSLIYDVFPLLEISWSKSWKEFVEGLRLDESGGWFRLEPAKGRLR